MLLQEGIKNACYSIFHAVSKRTTNRQQTENQLKLARKCFGRREAILWLTKYVRWHLRQTPIMYYGRSLKKISNKDTKKKKMQNYVILVFFSNKVYFQRNESH